MPTNRNWPGNGNGYGNGNGHDRFRDCAPGQIETTVDFTGSQGDPGRAGAQGPPGLTGPPGPQGASALTYTTCDFIMPAVNVTVVVAVNSAVMFSPGLLVYIKSAGFFLVQNVDNQLNNLFLVSIVVSSSNNAAPGTTIVTNSPVIMTGPAGPPGVPGHPSWTQTLAAFVVPQPGQSITVSVEDTDWMVQGAQLWVKGANSATKGGAFRISQILDHNTVVLINSAT